MINITNPSFIISAQNLSQCPAPDSTEVVLLGRSNVGKSSLINSILDKKHLAKSSSTPGKTRLINFFGSLWSLEDKKLNLTMIDLPGFGYAKVSKEQKKDWESNLVDFLQNRSSIKLFLHLVDSRHPNLEIDLELEKFLLKFKRGDQNILKVYTKCDKLSKNDMVKLRGGMPTSSLNKKNIQDLRGEILYGAMGWK